MAWNKKVDHNKTIQGKRSFRNPSLHGNLVIENNIEELGTSLPPHLCDDHLFGKESCYEELRKVQEAEIERREKASEQKMKLGESGIAKSENAGKSK